MKKLLFMIAVVSCFISKAADISKSHAQIISCDGIYMTGSPLINGFGDDATMVSGTANNIASAHAVRQFVHDSAWAYAYIPTNHTASRTLSGTSTFTISTTKVATVYYTATISCTATIGSTAAGSIALSYSTDGGTTYTPAGTIGNSNTVSLAIALNSVNAQTVMLTSPPIPANALCKLVTTTTGTTMISSVSQIENY